MVVCSNHIAGSIKKDPISHDFGSFHIFFQLTIKNGAELKHIT